MLLPAASVRRLCQQQLETEVSKQRHRSKSLHFYGRACRSQDGVRRELELEGRLDVAGPADERGDVELIGGEGGDCEY